ncbi:DNA methyltransferase [Microbacterium sp. M]|uniref:DNA methyltransferase n=1 Tax=Microbacterium sp. M TaxID=3377125 RepID=UPI0038639ABA
MVDVAYLDPPYNTGRNDRHHDDASSNAQWRSDIVERLTALRPLLSPTGVVIASINDHAHHLLRDALEEVFGRRQHLATVVVDSGTVKSRARWVAATHSYLVVFARSVDAYERAGIRWSEEREGVTEVLGAARRVWGACAPDADAARLEMRRWFAALPRRSRTRELNRYVHFLPSGDLARDDNAGAPHPGDYLYDLVHPVTLKPVPRPTNGWRHPEQKMRELAEVGRVRWGRTHRDAVAILRPLEPGSAVPPGGIEVVNPTHAARHLGQLIGTRPPGVFPKDHRHVARWIRRVTGGKRDAFVIDAYSGTGTVGESIVMLNAADGGERRALLIERDETVIERLLLPRLRGAGIDVLVEVDVAARTSSG